MKLGKCTTTGNEDLFGQARRQRGLLSRVFLQAHEWLCDCELDTSLCYVLHCMLRYVKIYVNYTSFDFIISSRAKLGRCRSIQYGPRTGRKVQLHLPYRLQCCIGWPPLHNCTSPAEWTSANRSLSNSSPIEVIHGLQWMHIRQPGIIVLDLAITSHLLTLFNATIKAIPGLQIEIHTLTPTLLVLSRTRLLIDFTPCDAKLQAPLVAPTINV